MKKVATDLRLQVPSNSTVCAMLRGFADQLLDGNYNCKSFLLRTSSALKSFSSSGGSNIRTRSAQPANSVGNIAPIDNSSPML